MNHEQLFSRIASENADHLPYAKKIILASEVYIQACDGNSPIEPKAVVFDEFKEDFRALCNGEIDDWWIDIHQVIHGN